MPREKESDPTIHPGTCLGSGYGAGALRASKTARPHLLAEVIVQNGWSRAMQVMRMQCILGLTSISDGLRLGPLLKGRSSRGWVSGPQHKRRAVQGLRSSVVASGSLEREFSDLLREIAPASRVLARILVIGHVRVLKPEIRHQIYFNRPEGSR